jgi:hypothetical protein
LAADEAKTRATLIHDAAQGQQEAAKDKYPFHPYAHWQEWQVVTDLPDWLSLSSLVGTDSGGAHPNYAYAAILWDKRAGQQRQALDLFTARAALAGRSTPISARRWTRSAPKSAAARPAWAATAALTPASILAQTLILGSRNHKTFDRIGFLIAPYEAGPYAEGSYEVTLPVTPAVLAAVKPEWRGALRRNRRWDAFAWQHHFFSASPRLRVTNGSRGDAERRKEYIAQRRRGAEIFISAPLRLCAKQNFAASPPEMLSAVSENAHLWTFIRIANLPDSRNPAVADTKREKRPCVDLGQIG